MFHTLHLSFSNIKTLKFTPACPAKLSHTQNLGYHVSVTPSLRNFLSRSWWPLSLTDFTFFFSPWTSVLADICLTVYTSWGRQTCRHLHSPSWAIPTSMHWLGHCLSFNHQSQKHVILQLQTLCWAPDPQIPHPSHRHWQKLASPQLHTDQLHHCSDWEASMASSSSSSCSSCLECTTGSASRVEKN